MTSEVLQAYFDRIGFHEEPQADLLTLKNLMTHHTRTIPFENLNPLLRIPAKIDQKSLIDKLIFGNRGGYCFEQNHLFLDVLKTLKFDVQPLVGRVNVLPDAPMNARTHMLLIVTLQNEQYLADVGFGGMTPTAPLQLFSKNPQKTVREAYRINEKQDVFELSHFKENEWRPLYEFDFQKQYFVDFQMANYYTSTHPDSHFCHRLSVARAGNRKRYGLNNYRLTTHFDSGETNQQHFPSAKELRDCLEQVFYLNLSNLPGLDKRLEEIINS